MDPVLNPYSPGAGRRPAALVGRDGEISAWRTALARLEQDRGAAPLAMFGLRGVGKTVLAGELARIARRSGWWVCQVEATKGRSIAPAVADQFHKALEDLDAPSTGRRVLRAMKTLLSFAASYDATGSWTFGVDLRDAPGGGADTGVVERDLRKLLIDLADAAADEGVGVAVVIDEAQDLSREELEALCAIMHEVAQTDRRVALVLAGLPSLPRVLAEAKSYAERLFDYREVGALAPLDAARALDDPAQAAGASWEPEAVSWLVDASQGYPYFVQQFGQEAWAAAEEAPITLADARLGQAKGQAILDTGFFRSRWDRATPQEKEYLRAMAVDGEGPSSSGAVADRMGKTTRSLGPTRASLIAKGLVYAPEHNAIRFTVPTMATFINRQPD